MAPFTPEELNHEIKNCFQANHQAPLASPTECYKLVTLISKDSFSSSSTVCGNFTHNPQTGNFLANNPSTKDTIRTKQTQHPTEAYNSMTLSPNSLKVSSLVFREGPKGF